ncbi:MAG: ferrous iron transport protein B, partial [Pyrinomonadaceae bacterium]
RKAGKWRLNGSHATLIDLPGLYSLEANSIDEQIARDVLLGNSPDRRRPDVIVSVVDATNLERNLYLTTQLLEFGIPVVVALSMIDVFEKREHKIDTEKLSSILKTPVIALSAKSERGKVELAQTVSQAAHATGPPPITEKADMSGLRGSNDMSERQLIFSRYRFISDAVQESVRHSDVQERGWSEKIDRVLTHRIFGPLILVAILLAVFHTIFSWAALPMDLLETGFGSIADGVRNVLPEGIMADLLADGVVAGVGGVLIFLPQILLLFLFISILEDTGYMARAAFLLDKLMSRVGLHGKAFLPLMSSFACAIPGIMATRTIENPRDRLATILIAPFMSCSARLPVYTLMIAAFFAGQTVFGFLSLGAVLMLAMYGLGISIALLAAFVLKRTLLKSPPPPFIMEMPPYRIPSVRNVLLNMTTRGWLFVKRAGTVILAISIVLWALMYFPRTEAQRSEFQISSTEKVGLATPTDGEQLRNSFAGKLGRLIEPVIQPLGFDWKIGVALIASFAAREVLVSTLSIIYNVGKDENEESETLIAAVKNAKNDQGGTVWTPLTALTLMVFFVLAMQCMSTVAIARRETNSWRWPLFMVGYMTVLAYAAAFVTYQGGRFLGF